MATKKEIDRAVRAAKAHEARKQRRAKSAAKAAARATAKAKRSPQESEALSKSMCVIGSRSGFGHRPGRPYSRPEVLGACGSDAPTLEEAHDTRWGRARKKPARKSPDANEVKFTAMPRHVDPMLVGFDEYPNLMNLPRAKHVANEVGSDFAYVVPAESGRARSSEAIDAWVPSSPEGAERFLVYVGRNRTLSGYVESDRTDDGFSAHVAEIAGCSFGGCGPTGFESTGRVFPDMHEAVAHIVRRSTSGRRG